MKPRAVIVDVAVDQGGCIETVRETTHENPTYELHGVVHYAVGNMPGAVPHTSTYALTNATLPYISDVAVHGAGGAARRDPSLALRRQHARRTGHERPGRRVPRPSRWSIRSTHSPDREVADARASLAPTPVRFRPHAHHLGIVARRRSTPPRRRGDRHELHGHGPRPGRAARALEHRPPDKRAVAPPGSSSTPAPTSS